MHSRRSAEATTKPAPISLLHARALRYRDFLTVALMVRKDGLFPDNWIYIHDPSVQVGRVQNFKSWSPEMVPDPTMTCYGLEYFCFEGDGLWTSSDADLIELVVSRGVVEVGGDRFQPQHHGLVERAREQSELNLVQRIERPAAVFDRAAPAFHRVFDALQRNQRVDSTQGAQRHGRALRLRGLSPAEGEAAA